MNKPGLTVFLLILIPVLFIYVSLTAVSKLTSFLSADQLKLALCYNMVFVAFFEVMIYNLKREKGLGWMLTMSIVVISLLNIAANLMFIIG